jgi:hypothetical protein
MAIGAHMPPEAAMMTIRLVLAKPLRVVGCGVEGRFIGLILSHYYQAT